MIFTTGCSLSAYQPVEQSLAYLAKASRCPLLLKQILGFCIMRQERRKRFQVLKSLGVQCVIFCCAQAMANSSRPLMRSVLMDNGAVPAACIPPMDVTIDDRFGMRV